MSSETDDKVWFNSQQRFAGICADVANLKSVSNNVLLLAHFPATLITVESSLRAADIAFQTLSVFDSSLLCSADSRGTVTVGLVRALQPPNVLAGVSASANRLQIVVAEHHPIHSKDTSVVDIADGLSCRPQVCFHTSLDDPLLKHFGSDKIVSLFKRLGMAESECISHPFVTAAIRSAQEKIEKDVHGALQTESIEDWFRFNMRDSRK